MTDPQQTEPGKLTPEQAQAVIKAIEEVEREECESHLDQVQSDSA